VEAASQGEREKGEDRGRGGLFAAKALLCLLRIDGGTGRKQEAVQMLHPVVISMRNR
jgi:hypothetical protein